jgi:alpha-tubulin suppressor-like RCC1 family protein
MKRIIFIFILNSAFLILNSHAQTIAGGCFHSLAVCSDSTARAWGNNFEGQLGDGTNFNSSNVPVSVSSLTGIIAIAGGGYQHSFALKNDGTVWAWGHNSSGQLGNGTFINTTVPVPVSSLTAVTAIAGGGGHSLALKNDGTAWAWGRNFFGQLGNGTNTDSNVPVQVSNLSGVSAIAAGGLKDFEHSLALKNDGTVWAWGFNGFGQLGNGTNTSSNVPVQTTGLCQKITAVNEITEQASVSVYPNPSTGIFTVHSSRFKVQSVEITDVPGREVLKSQVTSHNAEIDLSRQAKGIYFVKASDAEGNFAVKKIIVH